MRGWHDVSKYAKSKITRPGEPEADAESCGAHSPRVAPQEPATRAGNVE